MAMSMSTTHEPDRQLRKQLFRMSEDIDGDGDVDVDDLMIL